ncbi:MAG: hypothetical protein E7458_05955 [Ruminococcaceae bacterium]|nr:hypothetical protein [Oscillospiraceae bacterium]
MKRTIAWVLAIGMLLSLCAGCAAKPPVDPAEDPAQDSMEDSVPVESPEDSVGDGETVGEPSTAYTYRDAVTALAESWNPHTAAVQEAYPAEYLSAGLYSVVYNDALHPVPGIEPFSGYQIVPEMAAAMPEDVTEDVRAEHPEFGIPEDAAAGYAYRIDLNPNAVWEDGTPITAETYVYSMRRLLDPALRNARAAAYYAGDFSIAGAEAYANAGRTAYADTLGAYAMEDLTADEAGQYRTAEGKSLWIGLAFPLEWLGGDSLQAYVDAYGETYFDLSNWETLLGMADENGLIPLTEENLALFAPVITGVTDWGETEQDLPHYFVSGTAYPEAEYDGTVGLYQSGTHQITLVLDRPLTGYALLSHLTRNWIVYEPYYEETLTETDGVWHSDYATDVGTTMSCGPYRLAAYQAGRSLTLARNESWYGYSDGLHQYVDPADGETYPMYQTDVIECRVVRDAETRRELFLKGELMGDSLQAGEAAAYRDSALSYAVPSETSYFLIYNGSRAAMDQREAAEDFDAAVLDLQTLSLPSFRRALSLSYDRAQFAAAVSPERTAGFGLIGAAYVADPETGLLYRDTAPAKQVLCDFYGVDVSAYADLDAAVSSITGCDPEAAKALFTQAYEEALDAGYLTDLDGDGISDQTVQIEYVLSVDSEFLTETIAYLNEKTHEITAGTPFAGKIRYVKSVPYGNDWTNQLKSGMADAVLAGWPGEALDPYALTDLYVNPAKQYDADWFNAEEEALTLQIDGTDLTMNLRQWSDALNGAEVEVNGVTWCFGPGAADPDTRIAILADMEGAILASTDYIPMLQGGTLSLLSPRVSFVTETYHPVLGHGGIRYLRHHYHDAGWAEYLAACGGEISY